MRNFEERIAEIERRSEKIIKPRKQRRKHILMACVPLVLTVGIYTGLIAPNMHRKSAEEAPPEAMETCPAGIMDSMTDSVVEIQVEGVNVCYSYSSSTKVQTISGQLEDFSTRAPASGALLDEEMQESAQEDDSRTGADIAKQGYVITLILEGGGTKEYALVDNQLTDCAENRTYTLTKQQLQDLKSLLGIPLY